MCKMIFGYFIWVLIMIVGYFILRSFYQEVKTHEGETVKEYFTMPILVHILYWIFMFIPGVNWITSILVIAAIAFLGAENWKSDNILLKKK